MEQNRSILRGHFNTGDRPTQEHFHNLLDSFLHRSDDGLALDGSSNLLLDAGLRLGDSDLDEPGALRLRNGTVQFHNGTEWLDLGSGGGAFASAGGAGQVAYTGGNVGIGSAFAPANPPAFRLDVDLGENTGEGQRARFGNVVCSNGPLATQNDACIYHRDNQANTAAYALRMRSSGEVQLNALSGQRVRLMLGGDRTALAAIERDNEGRVIINASGSQELTGAENSVLQVRGATFKSTGGGSWDHTSDARVKEDVRDLEAGLAQLLQVRPVRFRFNGKADTPAGHEGVGVIGQEIERILPDTVRRVPTVLDGESESIDLRVYNDSALIYVMVNSIKELAAQVERLEVALAERSDP